MFGNLSGLFGGGNMAGGKPRPGPSRGQSIAGVLGDMLAIGGGRQAQFVPMLQQRQQMEELRGLQVQQAKTERDNAMQDWIARQEYERRNPDPARPGSFEWYQTADPTQRAMYDQYNPVTVSTAQGPVNVPRSSLTPPAGPVGRLTIIPDNQPMGATQGPPTSSTTPEGLGAMIAAHGVDRVQQWMQSGQLQVRGN
ncbi:hypothetical protein [Alteraurantiacibacter buctensis]|uniref:Uncharacterized protein n=1 Tax=Alteraurantiacibacter buctensis TaxID=1503981 RepID=A0A844Z0J6_9SPHN|nr:hypothetical protein [Alteraurantiacibacter buctensis]MXO72868.1 hypothetical protein [Alteraurantiacibacter buctensis]